MDRRLFAGTGIAAAAASTGAGNIEIPRRTRSRASSTTSGDDIAEEHNLYTEYPYVVERMTALLDRYKERGRVRTM